jgi:hypothetical protein
MASTPTGISVPAGGDPFDPAGDMVKLANSLRSRIVVPVANVTARTALLAAISWTPSAVEPLRVSRADAPAGRRDELTYDGTNWRTVGTVLDGRLPHIRMRKTTAQARPASAWGQVAFEATDDAVGDQPWTVAAGGVLTLNQDGLYEFSATISMTTPGTFGVQIRRSGDNIVLDQSPVSSGASFTNHAHATRRLSAGDLIIALVYPSASGMSVTVDAATTPSFMTITKLSD